jgi:hypothetical protein
MKKTLLFKIVVMLFVFGGVYSSTLAQTTTSTLVGVVKDATGGLPGASVKAVHNPTGTSYGVMTNTDGRFTIPNMRSGGPYTVVVSYVGLSQEKFENVYLKLGESFVLNALLNESETLAEVQIVSKRDATFNSKRTGAATNVGTEQIQNMPSLSRSLQDFTRLTPQANGNSFGGASNKFNNISIDGAVNNDVFGLTSTGAPGGQAATQPISLDAIEEIQIVVAPYDVTNGNSTGGTVNAVTRSGTNQVQGSAYFFGRNQNTVGKSVDGLNTKAGDFYNNTYGVRLGAPIIKNKLFFFVSAELGRIKTPTAFSAGDPNAVLTTAQAKAIADTLQSRYGYNVGDYGVFDQQTNSDKLFVRFDWNINDKNQLTLRHNYINAFDDKITRSSSVFAFSNNGYRFTDKQNSTVLELRSSINQSLSNNLILGYSRIRDRRVFNGDLFPQIRINNFNGSSSQSVVFGAEASSTANELDQDIFELTDNFKILAGKHTFTIGTHNEFFKFRNLFMNNFAGSYTYSNYDDFVKNANPNTAASTYSILPGNNKPAAQFDAAQLGFYFQDEIEAFQGFRLTAGFRVDVPLFFDNPPANPLVAATFNGQRTDQSPSGQILVSPRLSFNWDLTGDRSVQLRGGTGLLTSRAPFVWLSNQFTNNGMLTAQINAINKTGTFIPDPANQKAAGGVVGTTYEVNLADPKLRLPQVFKTNLAFDFKLPGGVFATVEGIYSKTVNNILYNNLNLQPAIGNINPAATNGADTRPLYAYPTTAGKVNTQFTNVYYLTNSNEGETYSITGQLSKAFDFGLSLSGAYTYGKSTDVNSGGSSTASSNFGFNQIVYDPNNPELSYSNFDLRHRIIGSLNYVARYGKNKASATTFSLFYAGKSGSPFTYLYFGDLNQDGFNQNDLLFVPRTISDIKLAPLSSNGVVTATVDQQWASLDAFISNDEYLNSRRGQYAERNGARMPWEHQFDVRIMQDLGTVFKGSKNALQISLDIINVGNLLNKDWGRNYFVGNNASTLINYNYNAANGGNYTFRAPNNHTAYQASDFASRWQAQFGIRYLFN